VNGSVAVDNFSLSSGKRQTLVQPDGRVEFTFTTNMVLPKGTEVTMYPMIEHFPKLESFHSQPAIYSTLVRDVQLVPDRLPSDASAGLPIRVNIYPLMIWLWIGGLLIVLGGSISLFSKAARTVPESEYNPPPEQAV